jgi:diguanylate cyclase
MRQAGSPQDRSKPASGVAARNPAADYGQAAMLSMLALRLSPIPEHYAVWYAYHAGEPPALRYALDERLAAQGRVAPADLAELHAAHSGEDQQATALAEISQRLEGALTEVGGLLRSTAEDATRYGNRLEEFGRGLASMPPAVAAVIARLLEDTEELCRRSQAAAHRITQRAKEAGELREALEQARTAARTDALTGLPNRRSFEEALAEEAARSQSEGEPLAVLILDVDHFKRVNDTYGHPTGDRVLRGVAMATRSALRPTDRPGRLGGEEFAILLPGTAADAARGVAERLRESVAAQTFAVSEDEPSTLSVTASFGVAERRPGETGDAMLARADAALYEAKRTGRNRVVSSDAWAWTDA